MLFYFQVEYVYDENVLDPQTEKLERYFYEDSVPQRRCLPMSSHVHNEKASINKAKNYQLHISQKYEAKIESNYKQSAENKVEEHTFSLKNYPKNSAISKSDECEFDSNMESTLCHEDVKLVSMPSKLETSNKNDVSERNYHPHKQHPPPPPTQTTKITTKPTTTKTTTNPPPPPTQTTKVTTTTATVKTNSTTPLCKFT